MPAWIINGNIEDIGRRGAVQLLSSCQGVHACPFSLGDAGEWSVACGCRAGARASFSSKMQSAFRKFRHRMPPAPRCSAFSSHARRDDFHVRTMGKGREMVSHLVLIELHGGYRESPKNKQGCLPPGGPWACRGLGVITPGVITPGAGNGTVFLGTQQSKKFRHKVPAAEGRIC